MKLTDLAIGDLVLINNTPHKIQAIDSIDAEILADDELYYVGEDRCHSEDKIEGIPLTPEILEKNGWERDIDKEWVYNNSHILPHYCYQWEKRNVKIEMYAGLEGFTISLIIGHRFYTVHELQHALRLCGLNELANNFKL